jgi:hypothetical protein
MNGKLLISTAYLPPVPYFSLIAKAEKVLIEREENYLKQTFRNRCYILSSHGPQLLSVPVLLGSLHKTPVKDIRIDYSKRWQQVHLRAINASYRSAPYFDYYHEKIENVISRNNEFLLDLNTELLNLLIDYMKINKNPEFTSGFEPAGDSDYDFRYRISPKSEPLHIVNDYHRVFSANEGYDRHLSIIDLIFNKGPEAIDYINPKART